MADDGLVFDADAVHAERIKEDQVYGGIRVTMVAHLESARIPLQIDIGFGDAVTPTPRTRSVPCILDFDAPRLAVYPWETVVAEKYQAVVALGMTNSRMKDFYDLQYMAREMTFDGATLSAAIKATFERRTTKLPQSVPVALSPAFAEDETVGKRWQAFIRRSRLKSVALADVTRDIWAFLEPVTKALLQSDAFDKQWPAGGAWA